MKRHGLLTLGILAVLLAAMHMHAPAAFAQSYESVPNEPTVDNTNMDSCTVSEPGVIEALHATAATRQCRLDLNATGHVGFAFRLLSEEIGSQYSIGTGTGGILPSGDPANQEDVQDGEIYCVGEDASNFTSAGVSCDYVDDTVTYNGGNELAHLLVVFPGGSEVIYLDSFQLIYATGPTPTPTSTPTNTPPPTNTPEPTETPVPGFGATPPAVTLATTGGAFAGLMNNGLLWLFLISIGMLLGIYLLRWIFQEISEILRGFDGL